MTYDAAETDARRRRKEIAPITRDYGDLTEELVLWPLLTMTTRPGVSTPVVSTDSRGHRVSRVEGEEACSDAAPHDAGFVLGGSFVFGVGASSDAGTLPSALWKRTGRPFVNLGLRQGTSTQELATALPFGERVTTFVVCSGLNDFAIARSQPLDPLLGSTYADRPLRLLSTIPIDVLERLARAGRDPLASASTAELRSELLRRLRGKRPEPARKPKVGKVEEPEAIVESSARVQLRDLRALRRLVPDEARVVFALQPVATHVRKELTDEERELFDALDVVQANRGRWQALSALFESHWDAYGERLAAGCAELGVPFADLSRADYRGWCFVDRIHMTERGYEQAAAFVAERLLDEDR